MIEGQDTIVRWSAAKYIARISECLPEYMAHQISEAILDTFEGSFEEVDMAENGLQGACFTFGELARRGRIQNELVDRLVTCALKVSRSRGDSRANRLIFSHFVGSPLRSQARGPVHWVRGARFCCLRPLVSRPHPPTLSDLAGSVNSACDEARLGRSVRQGYPHPTSCQCCFSGERGTMGELIRL